MLSITVKLDDDPFLRRLEKFERQVPFATALGLTRTAQEAQRELRSGLKRHFTIRSKHVERGIRIQRATKRRLVAVVGSKDDFMALQARGGTKRRSPVVGIPIAARPRPTSKTLPSRFPGSLLAKGKHFVGSPFGGRPALWRRMGGKRRPKLRLMYVFRPSQGIRKRWPFKATVRRVVQREWPVQSKRALEHALKTAR